MLSEAASSGFVLSSRRRRPRARARRRAQQGVRLPDWAWGLLLGLLAIFAVGGVFLVVRGGLSLGGGGGFCDKRAAWLHSGKNDRPRTCRQRGRKASQKCRHAADISLWVAHADASMSRKSQSRESRLQASG